MSEENYKKLDIQGDESKPRKNLLPFEFDFFTDTHRKICSGITGCYILSLILATLILAAVGLILAFVYSVDLLSKTGTKEVASKKFFFNFQKKLVLIT
jgi:hypothetical protein